MKSVYKLRGAVQAYSWGGTAFLPQLLHLDNQDQKPFAEYWLGAHPSAPAVLEETSEPLDTFIAAQPTQVLGERAAKKFGGLPYLFKLLDVHQMLSIQVHPSKDAAEAEFEKENQKGVPVTAPDRNYKDRNHKPEMMVALSDFYLLHGFKSENDLKAILWRVPELRFLLPVFEVKGYKGLYEEVMTMPQEKVDAVLTPLMQRIIPAYKNGELHKDNEDFWAARAVLTFCKHKHYDRGIFSIYFFNLLHLKEGEAIFQPAGLPHAYLEGQNVEVMAASDNVLRAGLTDKHVDVPELLKHVKFEATHPAIIRRGENGVQRFDAPVDDFVLTKHKAEDALPLHPETASIVFVYDGEGMATAENGKLPVKRGEALFVPAGSTVQLEPKAGPLTLYSVTAAV